MERFFHIFGSLTLFVGSADAMNRSLQSLQCEETLGQKESLEFVMPLNEFLLFLIDAEVFDITDWLDLKKAGLIPPEAPDKILQTYSELNGQWKVLWDTVRALRSSDPKERENIMKKLQKEITLEEEILTEVEINGLSKEQRKEKIWEMMDKDSKITVTQIAKRLNIKRSTAYEMIDELLREERVVRHGSNNGGYWETLRNGRKPSGRDPQKEREEKFLALVDLDSKITVQKIAKALGVSPSTIDKTTARLRQAGLLTSIGERNAKSRRWIKLEEGNTPPLDLSPQEREEKLLFLIKGDPTRTIPQLAEKLEVSETTLNRMIKKLKDEGRLEIDEYWKVLQVEEKPSSHLPQDKIKDQILELMREDPYIGRTRLTEKTGVYNRKLDRIIAQLKKEGRLKRIKQWKIPSDKIDSLM